MQASVSFFCPVQSSVPTNIVADEAAVEADNSHMLTTDNKTSVTINTGGYGNVADWNDDATAKNDSDESAAN